MRAQKDAPLGKVTLFDPVAQLGIETEFNPTFSASKLERAWILEYLGPFYEDHYIVDVLRQVKGGKEATVYCCLAHPRMQCNTRRQSVSPQNLSHAQERFRVSARTHNAGRGEPGLARTPRETRDQKEIGIWSRADAQRVACKRVRYLLTLHAAGVDVPKPIAQGGNTILMEYLGDASEPAPTLHTVELERDEAHTLFDRVMHNIEVMLQHNCVHADLSAFNILYWDGDIRIIDLPQAVIRM